MPKITVYRFQRYDMSTDENRLSRRWATLDAIASICAEALKETATEVDVSAVATDFAGMTEKDFSPDKRAGFQRAVTG